jgi:predicted metal-binding membrane protein
MPGQSWVEAAGMFELMWGAMMIAMMLPSSLPVMLQYYRMRRSRGGGGAIVGTGLMASGYFFVWTVAGVIIYLPGVFWASAAMRWGALSRAMPVVIGATLVVAGLWQFTPWKKYGLSRCRGPMSCGAPQTRDTVWSAWRQGVDCGLCCVLCCFGPTLILLALGMMNLAVIIAVAAMIALEKLAPEPKYFIRIAGVIAVLGGMAIIVRAALQA